MATRKYSNILEIHKHVLSYCCEGKEEGEENVLRNYEIKKVSNKLRRKSGTKKKWASFF